MLFSAQDHPHNPPATWRVEKSGRKWKLVAKDGGTLDTFDTKRAAEAAKSTGIIADLYEKERRWFAGEHIPGWKPYAEVQQPEATATHTPGPLIRFGKFHKEATLDVSGWYGIQEETTTPRGTKIGKGICIGIAQHEADAVLWAAAPEMLTACRRAWDNLRNTYTSDHIVIKSLREAFTRAGIDPDADTGRSLLTPPPRPSTIHPK